MSIKISFMHYMRWIRVMLPEAFKEFQVVYVFLATFCFSISLSIGKRSTLGKIWGVAAPSPPPAPPLSPSGLYEPVGKDKKKVHISRVRL